MQLTVEEQNKAFNNKHVSYMTACVILPAFVMETRAVVACMKEVTLHAFGCLRYVFVIRKHRDTAKAGIDTTSTCMRLNKVCKTSVVEQMDVEHFIDTIGLISLIYLVYNTYIPFINIETFLHNRYYLN